MVGLTYHAEAKAEARESARFYEEREPGLGKRFLAAVDETANRLLQTPSASRTIDGPYRRVKVRGFPYAFNYRVEPETVFVAAVMHMKRKPGYWRRRVEDT